MMAAVLANLENGSANTSGSFSDVADGAWYADAVNWAAENGIVNGYEDGTFRPDAPLTREQMAAFLYNYAAYKGYDVSATNDLAQFSDAAQVSSWATDVVKWAVGAICSMASVTTSSRQLARRRAQKWQRSSQISVRTLRISALTKKSPPDKRAIFPPHERGGFFIF